MCMHSVYYSSIMLPYVFFIFFILVLIFCILFLFVDSISCVETFISSHTRSTYFLMETIAYQFSQVYDLVL